MDLFDTGAYFSCKVPVIATTRPLLKSAVCALAAKHLSYLQCSLGANQGETHRQSRYSISTLAHSDNIDWQYQSVEHYHRAIGCLKAAIVSREFETDMSSKEEFFAAIAILCTHELMDAPGTAWKAHISALPFFSSTPGHSATPCSSVSIPHTAIKGPIFWSLARQDLLCACKLDPPAVQG
jgi:hypothetical protein